MKAFISAVTLFTGLLFFQSGFIFSEMTQIIDVHNHDAYRYQTSLAVWEKYKISKIVLFGSISEPAAIRTDKTAWDAFEKYPGRFYPFFAGVDIRNPACIEAASNNLEKGYFGIGEVVAASIYSPVTSKLAWKGNDPLDGYFPEIYALLAKYKAPILLHIDPPNGAPVSKLEEAMVKYPDTVFIFGHANAYNSPEAIESLLMKHPNLYIDFFAGFTAFDKGSGNKLDDFVPLMEKYSGRFLVSTDSAFGITYDEAYRAIYMLLDKLSPDTREKIAYNNFYQIIENEPITKTQVKIIEDISKRKNISADTANMNKRTANEFIIRNN